MTEPDQHQNDKTWGDIDQGSTRQPPPYQDENDPAWLAQQVIDHINAHGN